MAACSLQRGGNCEEAGGVPEQEGEQNAQEHLSIKTLKETNDSSSSFHFIANSDSRRSKSIIAKLSII